MKSYRIILADDHIGYRQGLKGFLSQNPDLEIVGEAGDGLELLDLLNLSKLAPHMVILDISMPKIDGIEATRQVKRNYPNTKVLILTIHNDREFLRQAISAGAEGYVVKEGVNADLFSAIETIRQGGVFVSPLVSRNLANGPG